MTAQRRSMRLTTFNYRFANEVLNSQLILKQEIEKALTEPIDDMSLLTRREFNRILDERFVSLGWERQPRVFDEPGSPAAKMDFLKERIGVEVGFGHSSFLGIDLLKFQTASYSHLNRIDLGVYIVVTKNLKRILMNEYKLKWSGSLTFEKVKEYLPHFKSAIQVPIYVIGLDL